MKNQFNLGVKHQLFNNEVRKRRLEMGLTQEQLAVRCDIGKQTLGHIETLRCYPNKDQAIKISKGLNTDISILFPEWISYFKTIRTSVTTEHLITERMIGNTELKRLVAENDVEDKIDCFLLKKKIKGVLTTLTPREEKVIRLRFGLDLMPKMGHQSLETPTLDNVARVFGVTRERIRQIEAKALRKLKHPSRKENLRAFL